MGLAVARRGCRLVNEPLRCLLTWPEALPQLDVGAGSLIQLADDRDDFSRRLDEEGNADDWLMIPPRPARAQASLQPGNATASWPARPGWISIIFP